MQAAFMGGRRKQRHHHQAKSNNSKSCGGALCCSGGSRLSTSSSASSPDQDTRELDALSSFAHAMVQARLDQMINDGGTQRRRGRLADGRYIILVALDKSSCDPASDFRESMTEVITSKGMEEPKELRGLLNCYLSMNSREHRRAILEAFYEVCAALFLGDR